LSSKLKDIERGSTEIAYPTVPKKQETK